MINETMLERLLELIEDESVADPITTLRAERGQEFDRKQAEAKERALSSAYRLARLERVPAFDLNGNATGHIDDVKEIVVLVARDLSEWAVAHGVKPDELRDVVESRRKETMGRRGERWQAYPSYFVDHSMSVDERDERDRWAREDARVKAHSEQRQKNAKRATGRFASTLNGAK